MLFESCSSCTFLGTFPIDFGKLFELCFTNTFESAANRNCKLLIIETSLETFPD